MRKAASRQKASSGDSRRARLPELDGAVVNVEITRYPKGGLAPAGRVIEILGRPGEIGVDVEIIIRKHHLPHIVFRDEVLAEARATPQQVPRTDLAGAAISAICRSSPSTAKPRAISTTPFTSARCPTGTFELQVHIADVAHYVRRASALDREARLRGTSVYFPNRAVPMLPEELSERHLLAESARGPPGDERRSWKWTRPGKWSRADFTPGVIRSAERMTYTNVNKVLEGDPEMSQRYAPLADEFRRMKELALLLNNAAARAARSISICPSR